MPRLCRRVTAARSAETETARRDVPEVYPGGTREGLAR
ncbi:MAG: hypothetical protein AVDCRST_MAG52-1810 [uncultured Blastococcus sp.]|uniref:Uncharacterized protein n=1 Tax=uncultured Blastococcus sp. TaxID=217144 RepID=A0A6J4IAD4_9ACTN|nr:MAG: hypothetical protein AVDCRST_MAG52-1810 [uncultured Blastococcus sp.]